MSDRIDGLFEAREASHAIRTHSENIRTGLRYLETSDALVHAKYLAGLIQKRLTDLDYALDGMVAPDKQDNARRDIDAICNKLGLPKLTPQGKE